MDAETRAALETAIAVGKDNGYWYIARLQALLDGEKGGVPVVDRGGELCAGQAGADLPTATATPPDAKKGAATFKLGDNPNEYADDAKPSLAERIDKIAASPYELRQELRAIAAELREIAEDIHGYRDTYTRGAYCLSDHKAKELADRLARREP